MGLEEKIPKKKELNLNKEYFNYDEASAYMCMSVKGFRNLVKEWDIPSGKVPGGRVIFRKADLSKLIERFFNAPKDKFPNF